MELRHLRYFVAVAEELHFGRAAKRLGIAQPPLSQQIRQLEEELGITLFRRTKRRVELTAAGGVFLVEVQRTLEQVQRAVQAAERASRGQTGRLMVGFVPSADLDVLPRVLRLWNARFPEVVIGLRSLLPAGQLEALRDGRIQVCLLRLPVDDDGLVVESIQREPLVAVLSEQHQLANRDWVCLADLRNDPLIVFPRRAAPAYYDLLVSACHTAGFTPRVVHETDNIQTNLGLVSVGLGFTLLPAAIQNLQRAGVVYRQLAPPAPHVEMAVAYARSETSPILPPFLEVVREVARDLPGGAPTAARSR